MLFLIFDPADAWMSCVARHDGRYATATYGRHGTWVQTCTAYVFTAVLRDEIDSIQGHAGDSTVIALGNDMVRDAQRRYERCPVQSIAPAVRAGAHAMA
ncbi:hypothetical protein PK69_08555 [Xanthomonas phaseoli pv. phaseoli]|uniref:Uncharacterized protein n=1 Tax=Xanthomonas campestris pv. phaseoli TaxID=317013 RepID=A0AB34QJH8_XANCH|nr:MULTISPECIES: hypothetical protein [Xanthomonas]ATS21077.1 hypothetical protein XppCFBP412P_06025 [Xanthomonas phaseoli pv. phaseoli]ATS27751.1 hypothetical protein XppCFBP6164P_21460 [Xanthomonas phaseoli pv. phaseoli]ATS31569.1 hypothetical protein XppCFBP6546P_19395 [Xanthomonas phaseoli pv. phaseoli]ATS35987.1 hypothetical protein XppCFBP6982P_20805 [Xanthomonas phaseoli pv. phaseoli]AZU12911.1 hypothetical protein AC609_09355 [Xanthomonas phaseoli pv. phaseoli]